MSDFVNETHERFHGKVKDDASNRRTVTIEIEPELYATIQRVAASQQTTIADVVNRTLRLIHLPG